MTNPKDWLYRSQSILGPLSLDGMEQKDIQAIAQVMAEQGVGIKTAYRDCLYHRKRFIAGTSLATNSPTSFFGVAINQQDAVANAPATTYTATNIDTNITQQGQIAKGQTFVVMSVQLELITTGATFTTITNGDPTAPEALAATSATNFMRALRYAGFFSLTIGERQYERGLIADFPQGPYGAIGFAGGGLATNLESLVNNGLGRERKCSPFHVIDAGRLFAAQIQWQSALVPTNNFSIVARLDGVRFTSVQ